MDSFQTLILLMFAAVILVGISQKIHVPYPICLVLGGVVIGLLPWLPFIEFNPSLLLEVVLPPILYYAAFGISFREFRLNWRDIVSLALGLVIFTTFIVGLIFKWMFPDLPWALAFTFGAIVSPPDAVAATSILKRFSINSRLLTIMEGESLVNDATAIVLYKLALIALLSGTFSFAEASVNFIGTVTGGIIVGLVLGYLMQKFSRYFLQPIVGVVFSFTIPYITFIIANLLGVSGVLAVVVNGLMGAQILARHHSSLRRIVGFAAWDVFIILMNCFVFILIGLQLRNVTHTMTSEQIFRYSGYAFLITLAMIVIRLFWVYSKRGFAYVKALRDPKTCSLCPTIAREASVIAWSGMRGIVSLAVALAIPHTLENGMPLDGRNIVIFIVFIVILFTLMIPGFTLAPLIRWLGIEPHSPHHNMKEIRRLLKHVADQSINHMHLVQEIDKSQRDFLKSYFDLELQVLEIYHSKDNVLINLEQARKKVIQEQRKKLVAIWEQFEIDDKSFLQLEHELDLSETHVARAELL